jgi:hypothetical protein
MRRCGSCGGAVSASDGICGACGALLTPADASQPPPTGPSWWRLAAALAGFLLVVVAAAGYTLLPSRHRPIQFIRLTLGDPVPALPEPAETPAPVPSPTPTESPAATATDSAATTDAEPSASEPPEGGGEAIVAGQWSFRTVLVNVTKADPSDTSFLLNREGIGMSEGSSRCVSAAAAADPRSIAFPFQPGMDCRPSSFTMADNLYRASLTCNFPQYGGRRPVEAEGRYAPADISVDLRVRVPAQVVRGDFENAPQIYLHYRLTGHRTQPC